MNLLSRLKNILVVCVMVLGVASCSSPTVQMYAKEKPQLDLATYFNGDIDAHGIFTNRSGEVVKRFKVVIKAKWETKDGKRVGVLDEDFTYSDGTKQKRIWTLTELAPGKYSGTASDVIGEAVGEMAGNALNWRYTLALPVDGTIYHVQFNDWMYLMDDKVMLNKAAMTKFGIYLGEVTLAFYKR
jgi:hypothetical protein